MNRTLRVAIPTAALALGIILFALVAHPSRTATGIAVWAATNTCECPPNTDRLILLHLSLGKALTVNSEPVQFDRLGHVLAMIYGTRAEKILYFSADRDVVFQDGAEVLDVVRNIRYPISNEVPLPAELSGLGANMNIQVRLVTPGAIAATCRQDCYNWGKEGILLVH